MSINPERLTASEITEMLAHRYKAPEWAFLSQVRNRTGYDGAVRTADAIAVSLWPSRGIELCGFEIKVSRSDWKTELADPSKGDAFGRCCHQWFIVAPEGVVEPVELPLHWGLMMASEKGIKPTVAATRQSPEPLPLSMLAAILRRCQQIQDGMVPASDLGKLRAKIREEERESAKSNSEYQVKRLQEDLKTLQETIKQFEEASGVKISKWNAGNVGEAVGFLQKYGIDKLRFNLENIEAHFQNVIAAIQRAKEALGTHD